jgi:hypothetical protein
MTPVAVTNESHGIPLANENFRRYTAWAITTNRTDAPDLMGAFSRMEAELRLAEEYREMAVHDLAMAEADMAVGFETLPPE